MGWFDCVASKYGCRLQGTTDVCFTVLDVLGYLDEIPVCTGYENCRRYVEFIEEQIGYPITLVSNGPARDDIIYRKSILNK